MRIRMLLIFVACFSASVRFAFADCTTMIIAKGASVDGSVFVCHSDDDDLMDQSIVHVPAREWPEGSMRPVYVSAAALGPVPEMNAFFNPRIVDADRAPAYAHPGEPASIPVGHIPQVRKTYAYLDGNYGIMNEMGLMFGECTNGTHFTVEAEAGKRIFYSAELSRVALERCATAREAIGLMGELIEEYGLYGTGETLLLADRSEAWVFEMAPSPEGTGGLWVAQRVPDGHFFIAANEFRIRDVGREDTDVQLHSPRLFEILETAGKLVPGKSDGSLDWLASVSKGEYNHPYYSLRRVWRGLSLVAPSLKLGPWISNPEEKGLTRDYPFSVAPDKLLGIDDIRRIYRDHYEGTEFDLTRGAAAGPFGNPNRFLGPTDPSGDVGDGQDPVGAWERPIGMFYTGYTFINQLRPELPAPANAVCWMGLNSPAETVFVPLAVGPVPKGYDRGDTRIFDPESAWRACNLVAEYANTKYCYIIKDIEARARKHEQASGELLERLWSGMSTQAWADPHGARDRLHSELVANAEAVIDDWRKLFTDLVVKYNQGFVNAGGGTAHKVGYPKEWLDLAGYAEGPISYAPISYAPIRTAGDEGGTSSGTRMSEAYIRLRARDAYFWGWPMVNMFNRLRFAESTPEPVLMGGIVPVAPPNRLAMLTDYVDPGQRRVACPNQDVVYGAALLDLSKEPVVVQAPDFGSRFWVFQAVDMRTDSFVELGSMYGSEPGFYLLAAADWDGPVPEGIAGVFRSPTGVGMLIPRVFQSDAADDKEKARRIVSQIDAYPLSEFDGVMKTRDWGSLPRAEDVAPDDAGRGGGETQWVFPETFFDELPAVLDRLDPLPGEEARYEAMRTLLALAREDPAVKAIMADEAREAEGELVAPFLRLSSFGRSLPYNWGTIDNGADFGVDYYTRTAVARSNIFVNRDIETKYFYQDFDVGGERLSGSNRYVVTFGADAVPARGFWSLTAYDGNHFFIPNRLDRYSVGTKTRNLKRNADGTLTLYIQAFSPGADREGNWLPVSGSGDFSLYLRAYWPEDDVRRGLWTPPPVVRR